MARAWWRESLWCGCSGMHDARAWAGLAARPRRVGLRVTCLRRCTCQRGRRNSRCCSWSHKWHDMVGNWYTRRSHSWKPHSTLCSSSRSLRGQRTSCRIQSSCGSNTLPCRNCRMPQGIFHCGQEGSDKVTQRRDARAGLWDTPAGVATGPSQPPPITRAVDFARDRRFVRRFVRLVV